MDTILIRRDTEGYRDDAFDEVTGQYIAPASDFADVYNGPGLVWCSGGTIKENSESFAGQEYTITPYGMLLPLSAPATQMFDVVTVTAATYDQSLLTKKFFAMGEQGNSYTVARQINLEERLRQLYPS